MSKNLIKSTCKTTNFKILNQNTFVANKKIISRSFATQTLNNCNIVENFNISNSSSPLFYIKAAAASHAHPKRIVSGTEDAFFISHIFPTFYSFGIADGVAAVRLNHGTNPALFSRALIKGAYQYSTSKLQYIKKILEFKPDTNFPCSSKILSEGLKYTKEKEINGSSTMCVVTINGFLGEMESTNLGDCQYLVIRDSKSFYKSIFQQHSFGLPFQLGNGKGFHADALSHSINNRIKVNIGDIIVLGSDGLFDNLSDNSIVNFVSKANSEGQSLQKIVRDLLDLAFDNSIDKFHDTPFSIAASKQLDMPIRGGNPDDITIIIAKIVDPQKSISSK